MNFGSVVIGGWVIGVAATCALPLSVAAQHRETAPCPRGVVRVSEKGVLRDVTNEPACRLVFRPTGVRLTAVGDGSRPDPGRLVVKDGRGRYYSAQADGWGPVVSVWGADGSYLSSFGQAGDGPGEFAGRDLTLFVDGGDSLHVVDLSNWSVFSPDHRYVRRAPSRLLGTDRQTTVILYDGKVLASDGYGSTGEYYFRVVDREGSLDRTFGTAGEGTGGGHYGHDRPIAHVAGYRTFWAGPSWEGSNAYVLEEWEAGGGTSADGPSIARSIRRHASWFKWTGDKYSSPMVRILHVTRDGLLYVQLWRPTAQYVEAVKRFKGRGEHGGGGGWTAEVKEMEALAESLTEIIIEVIDVNADELLVSATYPMGEAMKGSPLLPHRFFRNELTGYVYQVGEDGLPYVEIIEGVLEKR